jgi:hypothetical protein
MDQGIVNRAIGNKIKRGNIQPTTMKLARLFVPGRFVDTFVYMGRIAAINEERTLQIFDLDQIVHYVGERDPKISAVATLMFNRNDRMASPVFRSLMQHEAVSESILKAFDAFPQPRYELLPTNVPMREKDLGLPDASFLDMNIYNSRLYLGTSIGLFHFDLAWYQDDDPFQGQPHKRIDARCRSTSVGYGTINASCGDDGLHTAVDDFEWVTKRRGNKMKTAAKRPVRTNWFQRDLVNYANSTEVVLLRSKSEAVRRSPDSLERERRVITEIGSEREDFGYLLDLTKDEAVDRVTRDSIQFTYNSTSVLFVHTFEGNFYTLGMKSSKEGGPKLPFSKTYKGLGARILGGESNWGRTRNRSGSPGATVLRPQSVHA